MAAPYEIVAAPLTVYLAAVGTAFPDVDESPGGSWTKLGTSGDKNYSDDGVTVSLPQSIETFTPAGDTVPRKAFRTEEGLEISFTLVDLTPEQVAKVLDDAAITTVAASSGVPGTKKIPLRRGLQVANFALLARGISSVNDSLACQFEVDSCYQSGEPEPVFNKGEPAGLELTFTALDVAGDGNPYRLTQQTAAAS
ncbi:MAG: hypothetical protein KGZ65_00115 [Sphingomonadales bacterium]|nr:hypothetical protein [Sphingomonadaceae bacterium]MBS3929610.1 hypothetical protein [Sphingomonadales bacterium]